MRKVTIVAVFMLVFGSLALAQIEPKAFEVPKTEFFIGYAYQYADTSGTYAGTSNTVPVSSTSLNGFGFEFAHYLHGNFGYIVDFSRGSNSKVDSTGIKYLRATYMAGPSYRLHRYGFFSPSVHALAGVDHAVFTYPVSYSAFDYANTEFAAAAGVTVDGNLSRHVGIRLGQADYIYTHHYGTNQGSFRYLGGLVVRF
jgi:hypothetical protein